MSKKIIALTWGGTGWHVFPLLSLYNYLSETANYEFLWFGEKWWIEEEIANKYDIKFHDISAWKLRRYFDIKNFYEPLKNLTWIVESLFYIKKYNIDIVFSKWWYVSIPMAIWAKIMWKKLYIHESDTVSWISNRLVWKMATKTFYSFENDKIDNLKNVFSGQILNPELLDSLDNLKYNENHKQKVLITWWSQWSKNIFENVLKIIEEFSFIDFTVILWNKNINFREKFDKYTNIKVYDNITQKEFWKVLSKTDIAITRAWATSLWEQNVFWIHSIIVPLTQSAWDHQNQNAIYFNEKFESDILNENEELDLRLKEKLIMYKDLRKNWLNIKNFFEPLKIIDANMK